MGIYLRPSVLPTNASCRIRNVSAEIFVVCRDFLAPKHIDPRFLDPKHVFKDLSASAASLVDKGSNVNNVQANVFQPEKKRRQRDGYADGDYTLFKKASAGDFVRCSDPVIFLGSYNQISFSTDEENESVFGFHIFDCNADT